MGKRIALFSPDIKDFREWFVLTGLLKEILGTGNEVTVFSKEGGDSTVAYHEFSWRNLKNPFDLIVYNFSGGEDSAYMAPFLLSNPGMVIIRDMSFGENLWRMHTLDGSEQDFINEMVYCYGKSGILLGNLMWRGLWGEQLERKFPLLKIAAHGSLSVCGFDPWLIDRTAKESVFGEIKLLPSPYIYYPSEKTSPASILTFYTDDYPLLIDKAVSASRELMSLGTDFRLTVITDGRNREKTEKLLENQGLMSIAQVVIPADPAELDSIILKSSIMLFIEDPAAPVEYLPAVAAASASCAVVLTDSLTRLSFPDSAFPKFRFSGKTESLFGIIKNLLTNQDSLIKYGNGARKFFFGDPPKQNGKETKSVNPAFVKTLEAAVSEAMTTAGSFRYPIGYPEHLYNYDKRLLASMKEKLDGFPVSEEIERTLESVIGPSTKK